MFNLNFRVTIKHLWVCSRQHFSLFYCSVVVKSLAGLYSQLLIISPRGLGCFPSVWKINRITPILTSGCPTDVSNYRPISGLPFDLPFGTDFSQVTLLWLMRSTLPLLLQNIWIQTASSCNVYGVLKGLWYDRSWFLNLYFSSFRYG